MLDLIIPCYNPPDEWCTKFVANYNRLIDLYFRSLPNEINLIVINDGSTRNFCNEEILFLQQSVPSIKIISYQENKGKGYALREGFKKSNAPYCIFTDCDFPFGVDVIAEMYNQLKENVDILAGHRANSNYFRELPLKRLILSKGLILFNKWVLSLPVPDTQAGIKGFNKYGKQLFLKTTINSFLFDLELFLSAREIKELIIQPITVHTVEGIKLSKVKSKIILREIVNLFKIIFKKRIDKQNMILYEIDCSTP